MLFVPEEAPSRSDVERPVPCASTRDVQVRLRKAKLRPTRQRVAIGRFLFSGPNRHVTADGLFQELGTAGKPLPLATIYNTLNHFSEAGLLRRIGLGAERAHFDTDTGDHHHFYIEAEDRIIDVPSGQVSLNRHPPPPLGYDITNVDVVIRLRRSSSSTAPCLATALRRYARRPAVAARALAPGEEKDQE